MLHTLSTQLSSVCSPEMYLHFITQWLKKWPFSRMQAASPLSSVPLVSCITWHKLRLFLKSGRYAVQHQSHHCSGYPMEATLLL